MGKAAPVLTLLAGLEYLMLDSFEILLRYTEGKRPPATLICLIFVWLFDFSLHLLSTLYSNVTFVKPVHSHVQCGHMDRKKSDEMQIIKVIFSSCFNSSIPKQTTKEKRVSVPASLCLILPPNEIQSERPSSPSSSLAVFTVLGCSSEPFPPNQDLFKEATHPAVNK